MIKNVDILTKKWMFTKIAFLTLTVLSIECQMWIFWGKSEYLCLKSFWKSGYFDIKVGIFKNRIFNPSYDSL